ncbi:urease accessory protein UreF [Oricola indica]|uniref:urease accessory protein UreF n=1 Tax=Oricola indica TaxID=2872591 RepID=UPI001CC0108A|nr:urease accessory UreF family protein [Oricola indica]
MRMSAGGICTKAEAMNGFASRDLLADGGAMLTMLQLADSALPIGRHAHALGLERMLRDGRVPDAERLREVVVSALIQGCARGDGAAAALAHDAQRSGTEARLISVDERLDCLKLTAPAQTASRRCGRRLAALVPRLCDNSLLNTYAAAVLAERTPGHLAVITAATAAACGISRRSTVLMEVRGVATMILSAAVRLDVLPAAASQAMLAGLAPDILKASELALSSSLEDMDCSAVAAIEIAAMRHAQDHGRLFAT